ncbi:hypothetical protein A2625_00620 [candidate division WOR-1 bacterium RIFCSPHIGHO2_01_FULL_53_15]|uniref:Uncharacterized protein n=1 Tax=candidate division WOR-1 bacterium RIFCSPHIGHO2_01_FULL_53_15 TaxID=1802564 RepID=A0A1F4Q3A7_UNCSA|nr:MAG: hypothetical protein A2625_00620 [candidate division WOR-1 bacterium RIFCSPHIGHO2_01_FULL_53_15]OGC12668.1 MAG: hypothetical protein A3D23_02885 [candidate division WOR-1 bacterium RIFCSPHIGHO2_02_FULL_53_26]
MQVGEQLLNMEHLAGARISRAAAFVNGQPLCFPPVAGDLQNPVQAVTALVELQAIVSQRVIDRNCLAQDFLPVLHDRKIRGISQRPAGGVELRVEIVQANRKNPARRGQFLPFFDLIVAGKAGQIAIDRPEINDEDAQMREERAPAIDIPLAFQQGHQPVVTAGEE